MRKMQIQKNVSLDVKSIQNDHSPLECKGGVRNYAESPNVTYKWPLWISIDHDDDLKLCKLFALFLLYVFSDGL